MHLYLIFLEKNNIMKLKNRGNKLLCVYSGQFFSQLIWMVISFHKFCLTLDVRGPSYLSLTSWCPGSLLHQISTHDIYHIKWIASCPAWEVISTICVISARRNVEIVNRCLWFCWNLALKGLIFVIHVYSSLFLFIHEWSLFTNCFMDCHGWHKDSPWVPGF